MDHADTLPKILAVAVVILDEAGNILLRQRDKEPDKGKWQYAAGYVEPGERLMEAAQRKLREKFNITKVDSLEFTGKYYDEPNRHPGTYCIPLVFIARVKKTDITVLPNARWFVAQEAAEADMALDNKKILEDLGLAK